MFLKCSQRRKNGKVHRSWSVVESRRFAGGKVAQQHVLYLGELNDSQQRAWERSLAVFDEETGRHRQMALFPAARPVPASATENVQVRLDELRLENPRQWGACWLADHLWRTLHLDDFFGARLGSIKAHRNTPTDGQILNDCDRQRLRDVFKTIARPRESILHYSEPRVILSDDPAKTLDDVFGAYVERRFANAPEYQERVMCRRLQVVLKEADLLRRYIIDDTVGNDDYHVRFPFVKRMAPDLRPQQAIKALHLDRKTPTEIIRHADDWRNVVRRLKGYDTAPDELLFVLQGPRGGEASHVRAFDQVRRDLDQDNIPHLATDPTPDILAFASK